MNNSAGGCSISIKFSTDYDHVPPDLPQTFMVYASQVKVIESILVFLDGGISEDTDHRLIQLVVTVCHDAP